MTKKLTRFGALILAVMFVLALCTSCGNDAESESETVPEIDLDLPHTSADEPAYTPDTAPSTEPTTDAEPSTEVDPTTSEPTVTKAKTTGNVNMRDGASKDSTILAQLPKGAVLEVVDTSDPDWYKVTFNGKTGFVSTEYLNTNISEADAQMKGKVTAKSLNVRDKASSEGKSIGALSNGDIVTIIASLDGWYQIQYGSESSAFVSSEYVALVEG